MDVFGKVSDGANMIDLFTDLGTTALLYNNTKKAKTAILVASVAMSALAIGVSVYQTYSIKQELKKSESRIRDIILRNQ